MSSSGNVGAFSAPVNETLFTMTLLVIPSPGVPLNRVSSRTRSGSTTLTPLVPTVLAVQLLLPLVTMNPQRPSPSPHWLASTTVMPCDWACPACALGQSGSLYLGDKSMCGYLNPTGDSKDCSDVCFTVLKKKGSWWKVSEWTIRPVQAHLIGV